jgi:hypothetical protein
MADSKGSPDGPDYPNGHVNGMQKYKEIRTRAFHFPEKRMARPGVEVPATVAAGTDSRITSV